MPTVEEIVLGGVGAGITTAVIQYGLQETIAGDLEELPVWLEAGTTAAISTTAAATLATGTETAAQAVEEAKIKRIEPAEGAAEGEPS